MATWQLLIPDSTWPILVLAVGLSAGMCAGGWIVWRYWWFWRHPARTPPAGDEVLSPADGTVVYVRRVEEDEPIVSIKRGRAVRVSEIAREAIPGPKLLIGIFMSPFDVHYNRAPIGGTLEYARQHPARGRNHFMAAMFWRTLFRRHPLYADSDHLVENNRTVTKWHGTIGGEALPFWIVQIGARNVAAVDVYLNVGDRVERGEVFGMIRIGSQVDLIVPLRDGMSVLVKPGDRVRAGQTPLID